MTKGVGGIHHAHRGAIISTTIPSVSEVFERIISAYKKNVKSFLDYLKERGYLAPMMMISPWLLEPVSAAKASLLFPMGILEGWLGRFQFYGLNPTKITAEQAQMKPVLLIHGNYHNQSAWLPLAKVLQQSYKAPVFTINLNHGYLTEKDRPLLEKKLEEIKALYRAHGVEDVVVDYVGHSRGATVSLLAAADGHSWTICPKGMVKFSSDKAIWRKDAGRIIRIGFPTQREELEKIHPELRNRIIEIDGTDDLLVDDRSLLEASNKTAVPCGHLSLLYSPKVHDVVLQHLQTPMHHHDHSKLEFAPSVHGSF